MFDELTYEKILARMLERVSKNIDKREGSIVMTALAPVAMEIFLAYKDIDYVVKESYADTQSRDFLVLRAKEKGLEPKDASASIWLIKTNVKLSLGMRFISGEFSYIVIEDVGDLQYKMKCEQAGASSNEISEELIPLDYVKDLSLIEPISLLVTGEDEEETEEFRNRYFEFVKTQAFGGNVADYKEKTKLVDGVGEVKVIPLWDGAGTVKVIFTSSAKEVPEELFVREVQKMFAPENEKAICPIGHSVTVCGANAKNIDVETRIVSSKSSDEILPIFETVVDEYFNELTKFWSSKEYLIVRINQLESKILEIDGVEDVSGTTFNSLEENLTLEVDEIPVRGSVSAIIN